MRARLGALTMCTMNTHTDPDPNVVAVQGLYAAIGRGDMDAVLAAVSDDVDWAAEAASSSAPWYGIHHGREGVARFLQEINSTIEITEFTPHTFTSNGTDVMNIVTFAYTARATGRKVAMSMQHHWRLADGKVAYFRGAEDTEQSVAALS